MSIFLAHCFGQAPKKSKQEEDEDTKAFKEKQKQEAAALAAARDKGECPHQVYETSC